MFNDVSCNLEQMLCQKKIIIQQIKERRLIHFDRLIGIKFKIFRVLQLIMLILDIQILHFCVIMYQLIVNNALNDMLCMKSKQLQLIYTICLTFLRPLNNKCCKLMKMQKCFLRNSRYPSWILLLFCAIIFLNKSRKKGGSEALCQGSNQNEI